MVGSSLRLAASAGLLTALVLAVAGCRTYVLRPQPLATAEIIRLSAEKRPPEEIIQRIRESHTVYLLRARDVKDLLEKGVDERVVDEMLETRIRDAEAYYRSWYPYYPYSYGPYIGVGYRIYP